LVDKLVNKLPENQRTAIILRDYEWYDYKAIGEITGMTEAQVKINIFRARQFLKECIGKLEVLIWIRFWWILKQRVTNQRLDNTFI
jgi:RNA polymerase sigma-70 factor (ECF subfamily)